MGGGGGGGNFLKGQIFWKFPPKNFDDFCKKAGLDKFFLLIWRKKIVFSPPKKSRAGARAKGGEGISRGEFIFDYLKRGASFQKLKTPTRKKKKNHKNLTVLEKIKFWAVFFLGKHFVLLPNSFWFLRLGKELRLGQK